MAKIGFKLIPSDFLQLLQSLPYLRNRETAAANCLGTVLGVTSLESDSYSPES